PLMSPAEPAPRLQVLGLGGAHRRGDGLHLLITLESPRCVPEIRSVGIALYLGDLVISVGQFELQRCVAAGFVSQAVEVFEYLADDQFPRRRGARQVANGAIDVV